MNSPGVVPKAHVIIGLALMALLLTLAAACGEDSVPREAPPGNSPTVSDATTAPEDEETLLVPGDDEVLMYAIENPIFECRDGASWLSIRAIGSSLGDDTELVASPITPDEREGSFRSVGGFQSVETRVTSSRRAADVIGERDYLDDTIIATTVEARLPAFLTDSDYALFSVVLSGTDDESGERITSNPLNLETSAARC